MSDAMRLSPKGKLLARIIDAIENEGGAPYAFPVTKEEAALLLEMVAGAGLIDEVEQERENDGTTAR